MTSIWEDAAQAVKNKFSDIANPKEHMLACVDKLTQLDEKVSEFLVPQLQEISGPAVRFFEKMRADKEVDSQWADDAEEKLSKSQQVVEELSRCTEKVKGLLDKLQAETKLQWPKPTTEWRKKYSTKDNPPPGDDEPKEVWLDWLARKLTNILEFTRDEVMPVIMCFTAVPVAILVIISTVCPPLGHAAPGIFGGLATSACGIFTLNKLLPSLIEMLKGAQHGSGAIAANASSSVVDKLKNFMSSLQKED